MLELLDIVYRIIHLQVCACTANSAQVGSLALVGHGTLPSLGADISPLTLSIQNLGQAILRVTIGAPGRWEVPASQLFSNTAPGAHGGSQCYSLSCKHSCNIALLLQNTDDNAE